MIAFISAMLASMNSRGVKPYFFTSAGMRESAAIAWLARSSRLCTLVASGAACGGTPVARASRVAAARRPNTSSLSVYCLICCLSACGRPGRVVCACTSGTAPSTRASMAARHAERARSTTGIGNLQQRRHPNIGCLNDTSVVQKLLQVGLIGRFDLLEPGLFGCLVHPAPMLGLLAHQAVFHIDEGLQHR